MDVRYMLDQIKRYKNIKTDVKLAEILGITRQTITKWTNAEAWNSETIMRAFPDLNIHWVLTGEGDLQNPYVIMPSTVTYDPELLRKQLGELKEQLQGMIKTNFDMLTAITDLEKKLKE